MHPVTIGSDIKERLIARRGRVHLYDRIVAARAALVVIDMQNAFCQAGAPVEVPASRAVVPNINRLAAALREAGGDVVWIVSVFEHHGGRSDWENFFRNIVAADVRERTMRYMAPGGAGTVLWPELDARPDDIRLVKNRYGCLSPGASPLERVLRSRGIEFLLIAGTKTNICCETATRQAFDLDFSPILVEDCCAALSDREHLAALENVIQQFGDVMTTDEAIARLS
jgi:ureidoacrylate peracid hydrolase